VWSREISGWRGFIGFFLWERASAKHFLKGKSLLGFQEVKILLMK
jgi:hypothetical protein